MPTAIGAGSGLKNRIKAVKQLKLQDSQRIVICENPLVDKPDGDYDCLSTGHMKPRGLWYSPGKEWINWCVQEMPEWVGQYIYELDIKTSKILKIDTLQKLDKFDKEYRLDTIAAGVPVHSFGRCYDMDWQKLTTKYSGIEISPYQWERRLVYIWFYGWDVASGCIWDRKAIKKCKLIYQFDKKKNKYIAA